MYLCGARPPGSPRSALPLARRARGSSTTARRLSRGRAGRRTTPEEGGETVFPQAATRVSGAEWSECAAKGLAVKTRRGDALLFYRCAPRAAAGRARGGCPRRSSRRQPVCLPVCRGAAQKRQSGQSGVPTGERRAAAQPDAKRRGGPQQPARQLPDHPGREVERDQVVRARPCPPALAAPAAAPPRTR
jgi:hypothetical protein